MNRPLLRAPKALRRRPFRARRVVTAHAPIDYSAERPASLRFIIVATVLAVLVTIELLVAVAVIS